MNSLGESTPKCSFCNETEGLTATVISNSDGKGRKCWLCDDHYREASENTDYRVREIPEPTTTDDYTRSDVSGLIIYWNDDNEDAWICSLDQDDLEVDLSQCR